MSDEIPNLDEINKIFTDEGTAVDLIKRLEASKSKFARATLKKIKLVSPLSIAVVFEQLKRGRKMDLESVF